MKRILAMLLACLLMLLAIPAAMAAEKITGVKTTLAPWAGTQTPQTPLAAGSAWYIQLGTSNLVTSVTNVNQLLPGDLANLSAVAVTLTTPNPERPNENTNLISMKPILVNDQWQPVDAGATKLAVQFARNTAVPAYEPQTVRMNVSLCYSTNGQIVQTTTPAYFTCTVPADYTDIRSDNTGRSLTADHNGRAALALPSSLFAPSGNGAATNINKAMLDFYGITVSSSNPNIQAVLVTNDGAPYILLTKTGLNASETTGITVSGTRGVLAGKSGVISGVTLTGSLITGLASGGGAPVPVNLGNYSAQNPIGMGNYLLFNVQDNNFTGTATANSENIAYLNQHKDWVEISSAQAGHFNKEFVANGDRIAIKLTLNTDTPVNQGLSVGLRGNSAYTLAQTIPNQPDTQRFASGIAANSPAPQRADALGSTMLVGNELVFNLLAENFTWTRGTKEQLFRLGDLNPAWIKGYDSNLFTARFAVPADGKSAAVILTAKAASASPTNVSLFLSDSAASTQTASAYLSGISVSTPITGNKITGINPNAFLGANITVNGVSQGTGSAGDWQTLRPGDKIQLHFDSNFFTWENGNPSPAQPVTSSMLSAGRITLGRHLVRNGNLVNNVRLVTSGGKSYIEIELVDYLASTSEKELRVTVFLQHNGSRSTETQVELYATVENEVIYLYDDADYEDISDGQVIYTYATVRNIELYIGEGISLYTTLFNNRRYYATASMEFSDADERVIERYPSIEIVYALRNVGISTSGSKLVGFDLNETYHVYDADGKYLGTTKSRLPYSSKYYLSTKKITLSSEDVEEVDDTTGNSTTTSPTDGTSGGTSGTTYGNTVIEEEQVPLTSGAPVYNPHNGASPATGMAAFGAFLLLAGLALFRKR